MKFSVAMLAVLILGLVKLPVGGCGGEKHARHHHAAEAGSTNAAPAKTLPPPIPQAGPQVQISAPLSGDVLETKDVGVFVRVRDLPTQLGAHLHVMLDDQPVAELSDPQLPVVFRTLVPGWHVVRVFACNADHISFRNLAAFAVVPFKVGSGTEVATFDPALPTLTFNLPTASYRKPPSHGLPVDFLVNGLAPGQWRVRISVDGEPKEELDRVDPGFRLSMAPGEHVVRMELLDTNGKPLKGNFAWCERTVRVR